MTGYKPPRPTVKVKFMQTFDRPVLRDLKKRAKKRGIILQELLRAVVIPEWLVDQKAHKPRRWKKHHPRHASR